MVTTFTALWGIVRERHELIYELTQRELRDRHNRQIFGTLWEYGHPLLLMLVYTGLFAYVFPTRYSSGDQGRDYATCILAGILPWLVFQELLARSPVILLGHANLVKQIIFPVETLPVKTVLASTIPYLVGLIFTIFYSLWHGNLTLFSLIIPWLILCQFLAMLGVAFFLSAAGVFFHDLRELIRIFCTVNLFAQPILYNPYATPKWMTMIFHLNPFSYLTWCWQDALYYGMPVHLEAWFALPLLSLFSLWLGWTTFRQTHHLFGDAL